MLSFRWIQVLWFHKSAQWTSIYCVHRGTVRAGGLCCVVIRVFWTRRGGSCSVQGAEAALQLTLSLTLPQYRWCLKPIWPLIPSLAFCSRPLHHFPPSTHFPPHLDLFFEAFCKIGRRLDTDTSYCVLYLRVDIFLLKNYLYGHCDDNWLFA